MHGRKRIIPALAGLLLVFAVLFSGTFIGAPDTDVKLNNPRMVQKVVPY